MPDALPVEFAFTCIAAPVQAEGTIAGRHFYFRSRNEKWEFTVAERTGDDPVMIGPEDVASGVAWYRAGDVPGGRFAASYLPLDHATSIIHECARDYIREHAT
jgi:hypothetical protein